MIRQSIDFPEVTAAELFSVYVDPVRHAAAVGAPVSISSSVGAAFSVFGEGKVRGVNLALASPSLIVQSWRGTVWRDGEPDSILVLAFVPGDGGARVELLQAGVPEHAVQTIERGWHEMYWRPWRAYLGRRGA